MYRIQANISRISCSLVQYIKAKRRIKYEAVDFEYLLGTNQPSHDDVLCGWVVQLSLWRGQSQTSSLKCIDQDFKKGQFYKVVRTQGTLAAMKQVFKMHLKLLKKCKEALL